MSEIDMTELFKYADMLEVESGLCPYSKEICADDILEMPDGKEACRICVERHYTSGEQGYEVASRG